VDVTLTAPADAAEEHWRLSWVGAGVAVLRARATGQLLTATPDGGVQLWEPWREAAAQRWLPETGPGGGYHFRNQATGLILTAVGGRVVVRPFDGGRDQGWRLWAVRALSQAEPPAPGGCYRVAAAAGPVLTVPGGTFRDGAGLAAGRDHDGWHQHWRVEPAEGPYLRLVSRLTGGVLDVNPEAAIIQAAAGGRSQHWQLLPDAPGTFALLHRERRLVLELAGGPSGLRLGLHGQGVHQHWRFLPVPAAGGWGEARRRAG
jgi:hypothetical protein